MKEWWKDCYCPDCGSERFDSTVDSFGNSTGGVRCHGCMRFFANTNLLHHNPKEKIMETEKTLEERIKDITTYSPNDNVVPWMTAIVRPYTTITEIQELITKAKREVLVEVQRTCVAMQKATIYPEKVSVLQILIEELEVEKQRHQLQSSSEGENLLNQKDASNEQDT